jgi:hypothetical protein
MWRIDKATAFLRASPHGIVGTIQIDISPPHHLSSKKMNNTKYIIIGLLVFIAVSIATVFGLKVYRERHFVTTIDTTIDQLKTEAQKTHPKDSAAEGMQKAATDLIEKNLAKQPDDQKKALVAANTFWGFYYVNVRERKNFCNEQGVDIAPFVVAFTEGHKNELRKFRTITKLSDEGNETRYKLVQPAMRGVIAQDMADIATQEKVSLKAACQIFVDSGTEMAAAMNLTKLQPAVAAALAAVP